MIYTLLKQAILVSVVILE